uniref:Ltp family lipoprotein n=1 Tax=Exiguobacterium sp. TaxID=44751 RepID=UPI0028B0C5AE
SDSGEKFTSEEAQYAIDTLDVDYNQNALQKAKEYQETMSMSPESIRDQLSSDYGEKFTPEEANFAVSQLK